MTRSAENSSKRIDVPDILQGPRLHLGSGMNVVDDWINLDGSLGVLISKVPGLYRILRKILGDQPFLQSKWSPKVKFHDVRKPLPFNSKSLSAIYSSHMLEHLYRNEQERLIKECYRVLRPGGVIRIVVPDLAYIIKQYEINKATGDNHISAATKFNLTVHSHPRDGYSGNLIYRIFKKMNSFQEHRWMHDKESLVALLASSSFVNIRVCHKMESSSRVFDKIEQGAAGGVESLYVEAER